MMAYGAALVVVSQAGLAPTIFLRMIGIRPVDWYMNSQTTPTATMERMTGRNISDCRKFLCRISRLPNIRANTKASTLMAATLTALKWSVRTKELMTTRVLHHDDEVLEPDPFWGVRTFHSTKESWKALIIG